MNYTETEKELYYWSIGKAGSFTSCLFELITKADVENKLKLLISFPEHVNVIYKYQNEENYYDDLCKRIKG
jgi:hypothetical protein